MQPIPPSSLRKKHCHSSEIETSDSDGGYTWKKTKTKQSTKQRVQTKEDQTQGQN